MTARELASRLQNVQYLKEDKDKEIIKLAKESGLVIVYGYSDDLVELRGAIDDEFGMYGGGKIFLAVDGLNPIAFKAGHDECECEFCGYKKLSVKAKTILAKWNCNKYSWFIESNIKFETFDVLEEEEKYCRGIVFNVNDITAG